MPGLLNLRAAAGALPKVVGELGGVLGGEALQIRRITLNRRSMHTQNHGHLRERLARTASQKRLGLFMRGIAFFAHKSLRHPDVTRRSLEQTGSNPTNLRLVELDRRRLVVTRSRSVRALALPGAAVEHPVRGLPDIHRFVLVEL